MKLLVFLLFHASSLLALLFTSTLSGRLAEASALSATSTLRRNAEVFCLKPARISVGSALPLRPFAFKFTFTPVCTPNCVSEGNFHFERTFNSRRYRSRRRGGEQRIANAVLGCTDTAGCVRRRFRISAQSATEESSASGVVNAENAFVEEIQKFHTRAEGTESDENALRSLTPFVLDGSVFKGASAFAAPPLGYQRRMVPYDRSLALRLKEAEVASDAEEAALLPSHSTDPLDMVLHETKTVGTEESSQEASSMEGNTNLTVDAAAFDRVNFCTFFAPGMRYQRVREGYLVFPPTMPDQTFFLRVANEGGNFKSHKFESDHGDTEARTALENANSSVMAPSFLNPKSRFLRTGAAEEEHRRKDSGLSLSSAILKEMLDSIDWEREHPTHQDTNYFKRNTFETQLGDPDRSHSSYFDPQYIGAIDAFPYAEFAHKTYTWQLLWIPYLALRYFKGNAPIRSPIFSLAGVDPLQLWFYPTGSGDAPPGFCSVKLVSRPGWHLPFKIKVWARGVSAITAEQRCVLLKAFDELSQATSGQQNERTEALAAIEAAAAPSEVCIGPYWREEAEYVAGTTAFCRLLNKGSYTLGEPFRSTGVMEHNDVRQAFPSNSSLVYDPETDVILDAFGGIRLGVSVCGGGPSGEDPVESDFGAWEFEQWLKRQSAFPDDQEMEETLPAVFTHSPMYESFRYSDIPDKHFSRYLPQSQAAERTAKVACNILQPHA